MEIRDKKQILLFDEIGLAELSESNPLKLLHYFLEIEEIIKYQFGFIGISNWRLDASKLNRCLFISRADPLINDLKYTAVEIMKGIHPDLIKDEKIMKYIDYISDCYIELKEKLKKIDDDDDESSKKIQNFIGLRDFYSTIKYIAYQTKAKNILDEAALLQIIYHSFYRNFGNLDQLGMILKHDAKKNIEFPSMKKLYYKKTNQKLDTTQNTLDMIIQNVKEISKSLFEVRYPLIIVSKNVDKLIVHKRIKEEIKIVRLIIGSLFIKDMKSEE